MEVAVVAMAEVGWAVAAEEEVVMAAKGVVAEAAPAGPPRACPPHVTRELPSLSHVACEIGGQGSAAEAHGRVQPGAPTVCGRSRSRGVPSK